MAKPARTSRPSVQSVESGGAALLALATCPPASTLTQLAASAQMPPAKLHRYLQALIAGGFAVQDSATGRYALGPASITVGLAALGRIDAVSEAANHLPTLRDATGLTCLFAIWANHGATVVRVAEAPGSVTVVTRVGSVLPLHGSATGLLFAALLPPTVSGSPEAGPPRGLPSPLAQRLQIIRAEKLCLVHGLLLAGIDAAAAPVFRTGPCSNGSVVAGVLTILGPAASARIAPGSDTVAALTTAAARFSAALGATGGAPSEVHSFGRPKP